MKIETTFTQLETAQLIRHISEEEATYMFEHLLTQDAADQSLLVKQRRDARIVFEIAECEIDYVM